jgi:hypothetical protein
MSIFPRNMFFTSESVAEGHPEKFCESNLNIPDYGNERDLPKRATRLLMFGWTSAANGALLSEAEAAVYAFRTGTPRAARLSGVEVVRRWTSLTSEVQWLDQKPSLTRAPNPPKLSIPKQGDAHSIVPAWLKGRPNRIVS